MNPDTSPPTGPRHAAAWIFAGAVALLLYWHAVSIGQLEYVLPGPVRTTRALWVDSSRTRTSGPRSG